MIIKKEIYAKTDEADKIIKRTINLLMQYKNIIKSNLQLRVNYKQKKRQEIEKHPSMRHRRKLIEERNEWKWWEYFEHALVIRKWRSKGLGWNGVLKVTGM